jgi:hypothetical protein
MNHRLASVCQCVAACCAALVAGCLAESSESAHGPIASRRAALVDGPISFAKAKDVSAGAISGVSALDARDLDGDGLVDIGVFEGGKHAGGRVTFAWFRSPAKPSSGGWTRHDLTLPSPSRPFIGAARFGDVDGDGDYDLVVSMDNHSGGTKSAYLHWLENPRPGAAATTAWTVRKIAGPLAVHHINDMELGDLDGDGKLDVVVRALDPNQLQIYFQDSKSSWTQKVIDSKPFGPTGEGFALGQIDGAGQLDISICGHWLRAPTKPRTGSYTSFTIDAQYKTINANVKEAIGDIDGDGRADVLISPAEGYRNGANHDLAWYKGPTNPSSSTSWKKTVLRSNFNGGHTARLVDIDGDNDLDVVSGVAWSSWGQTRSITIYYNLGGGTFGNAQTVVTGKGLYSGVVRDLGADGDLDIIGQDYYSSASKPYIYVAQTSTTPLDAGAPQPDSSAPQPDSSAPQPDSSAPQPDSSAPQPDSSAPQPDSSAPQPDSSAPQPDGSAPQPDGGAPQPDGSAPQPDGGAPQPDGAATDSSPSQGTLDGGCAAGGRPVAFDSSLAALALLMLLALRRLMQGATRDSERAQQVGHPCEARLNG